MAHSAEGPSSGANGFVKRPVALIGKERVVQKLPPNPCILSTTLCVVSGSPSADVALLVEADGFAGLALSTDFFLGVGLSLRLLLFLSKMRVICW